MATIIGQLREADRELDFFPLIYFTNFSAGQ
jgi:hypothetical protein